MPGAGILGGSELAGDGAPYLGGSALTVTEEAAGETTLNAEAGSYAVTGAAADLLRGFSLDAEAGTYTLTGASATLVELAVTKLFAEAGSYGVTGSDAGFIRAILFDAEVGAYELSGEDAELVRSLLLEGGAGSYSVAGQDATLDTLVLVSAAPDGDVSVDGWLDEDGGNVDIYVSIAEATADDADYVQGQILDEPLMLVSWTPS